jgi:hypothetical protein
MTEPLWTEASQYLKVLCPAQYKELRRCQLPVGIKKLAGVWCSFAVNRGSETEPVQTDPHTDYKSVFLGKSCLYPFGDFEDGGVVLWELKTILVLKPGDLFFFEDHLRSRIRNRVSVVLTIEWFGVLVSVECAHNLLDVFDQFLPLFFLLVIFLLSLESAHKDTYRV